MAMNAPHEKRSGSVPMARMKTVVHFCNHRVAH